MSALPSDEKFVLLLGLVVLCLQISQSSTSLTSNHTTSPFGICPQATLTCSVNNLPGNALLWFFDQRAVASYTLLNVGDDQYPLMLSSPPELADVVSFEILEASISENVANTNFISTMRANLSSLREAGVTNITCGNRGTRTNGYLLDFDIVLPPPPFSSVCSIVFSTGSSNISIQWIGSSHNQVDIYQVEANVNLTGCSRDVMPGKNYSCSGLTLGTLYSFTVNATNCESQTSSATFTIRPQVPQTPMNVQVIALYDDIVNLNEIIVHWNEVDDIQLSNSDDSCIFDEQIDYTLILEDGSGMLVDQRILTSSCCINRTCSTAYCNSSFLSFQPSLTYSVTLKAGNAAGHSDRVSHHGIEYSFISLFNLSLSFENCKTTIECISGSTVSTGWCSVDFGIQELSGEMINNSLNSPFNLPLLMSSSEYHISTQVQIDNTSFVLLRNFSTGKFDTRLNTQNQVLVGFGATSLLVVISIYFILGVVLTCHCCIKGIRNIEVSLSYVFLEILLMIPSVLLSVASLAMWIEICILVSRQINTCDLKWQATRNALILAAFLLSVFSLLFIVLVAAFFRRMLQPALKFQFSVTKPDMDDLILAEKCSRCKVTFRRPLIWNRKKINCPGCGQVVCNKCLKGKAYLQYLKDTVKVCNNCVKKSKETKVTCENPKARGSRKDGNLDEIKLGKISSASAANQRKASHVNTGDKNKAASSDAKPRGSTGDKNKAASSDAKPRGSTGDKNKAASSDAAKPRGSTGDKNKAASSDAAKPRGSTGDKNKATSNDAAKPRGSTGDKNKAASSDAKLRGSTSDKNKAASSDATKPRGSTGDKNKATSSDAAKPRGSTGDKNKAASSDAKLKGSTGDKNKADSSDSAGTTHVKNKNKATGKPN